MVLLTVLVKSEKYGKNCLACIDENKKWIRPIKPGGFGEEDIIMNNGKKAEIFDVVDIEFCGSIPLKHHTENMKFALNQKIKFIRTLDEEEQSKLLAEITDDKIIKRMASRLDLHDEIENSGKSIGLVGPIGPFDIQYNCGNHHRLWILGKDGIEFSIPCTDLRFCKFISKKVAGLASGGGLINSQSVPELRDKETFSVIGLTGDSIDENKKIRDGRYAPEGSSMEPRYWPMVVSVLTVPTYSNGED
jgi:hypothetical protein